MSRVYTHTFIITSCYRLFACTTEVSHSERPVARRFATVLRGCSEKKTTKPASGCNHRHSEDTRGSSCTSTTSAVIEQTVVTQHTIKTSTTLESNRGTHAPRACTSADILGRGHNCRIFFPTKPLFLIHVHQATTV